MIEFLTVSSVNADNRKRDVFPGSRGQSVRGAKAHEPWGHYFYSSTLYKFLNIFKISILEIVKIKLRSKVFLFTFHFLFHL